MFESVLDVVGATPLVRLPRMELEGGARIALKLEFTNPLGSVKDRIGLAMVRAAEAEGVLQPGRSVLVEPTSGNTGIALAFVAAARGYRLVVVMPDNGSLERRRMMKLLGAELELTPARLGMQGAIERAEAVVATTPHAWMLRQFENPANPAAHVATAQEIWHDTDGAVDAVVAGVGTGGTLTGIARTLKALRPDVLVAGVEPAESAVLSGEEPGPHGIQGIGAGFVPAVLDRALLDEVVQVSEAEAMTAARRCAREEGIPIGISSGAVLHALLQLAQRPALTGRLLVGIAASSAERYQSTRLFAGF